MAVREDTMPRIFRVPRRRPAAEAGFAMIAAVLISMIVLILGATAIGVAMHSSFHSGYSRSQVQALDAAEAGIDQVDTLLQSDYGTSLPCSYTGSLSATPTAKYSVSLAYYSTSTPSASSYMTCSAAQAGTPLAAILVSEGTSPASGVDAANESMEQEVTMTGTYAPYSEAVFSNQTLDDEESLTVNGSNGNNGSVYTNGSYICTGGDTIQGSVYAQGWIQLEGNCKIEGSAYADEPIAMSGTDVIDGSATSSTSCVLLDDAAAAGGPPPPGGQTSAPTEPTCPSSNSGNAPPAPSSPSIKGAATAGTLCAVVNGANDAPCSSSWVSGTVTQNHISSAPPTETFPVATFDPSAWTAEGYTIQTFTGSNACTTAETDIDNDTFGTTPTVVNLTGSAEPGGTQDCPLMWPPTTAGPGAYVITLQANLAIVTNGPVFLDHDVTIESNNSTARDFLILMPDTTFNQDNCVFGSPIGNPPPSALDSLANVSGSTRPGQAAITSADINEEDNTTFTNVDAVYYTPCSINNEQAQITGQLYAGMLFLQNSLDLTYDPILIPGTGQQTGNTLSVVYLRQVATATTPVGSSTTTTSTSTTTSSTTTTSTSTTTTTLAGLAGLGWTSTSLSGGSLACGSVSQSVTCTAQPLGGTGSFSGKVTLENSSGTAVTNTGSALTVNCSETTVSSPGGTVSPSSSSIANGASASSSAFTLTGGGAGWKATMTCTVVVAGTTYSIAVTGN